MPEWWQQCTRNADKVGLTPLLLIKRSREEPLAVLRWSDLLGLLRQDHRWQNLAEGLMGGRA
ncbi:putative PDDEXK endonuclease [Candidatus Darwinibacter acetoxidans]